MANNEQTKVHPVTAAWTNLLVAMGNPVISVPTGTSGNILRVEPAKISDPEVIDFLLDQAFRKPLTDISRGDRTEAQWHEARTAKRDAWYNGTAKRTGGNTGDPVLEQMKEEIALAIAKAHNKTVPAARKLVKGTAKQFIESLAAQLPEDKREAYVAEKLAHFRAKAEASIAAVGKAKAAIEIKAEDLNI